MNKKKLVGIITIHDNNNIGNVLQRYAMQKILIKKNFYPIELHVKTKKKNYLKKIKIKFYNILLHIHYKILFKRFKLLFKKKKNISIKNNIFVNKNINQKKFDYSSLFKKKISEKFSFFLAGSDVIWNPYAFVNGYYKVNFLQFVEKRKRISYAASFGCYSLPSFLKKKYTDLINSFSIVSFREKVLDIKKYKYLGIHLDPTFLLTRKEWIKIEKKPKNFNFKKYILVHSLVNEIPKEKVNEHLKKHNIFYPLVYANNYSADEFIYLVRNSKLIITNSFHGVVFAIIFYKNFFCIQRQDMYELNNRILTVLKKFKLLGRFKKSIEKINFYELKIKYHNEYNLLIKKKSLQFLSQILKKF